jgi:glycosyltransferase involved in cell wall biosynthesis
MRVLFITKQQYMAKDLLADRFGRFYELPRILAQSGHQVQGVCLKYWPARNSDASSVADECVEWSSFSLGVNWPLGFLRHYARLRKIAERFMPDIIVGASDCFHVVMAFRLALKLKIPYAVDLYDNFEAYRATQFPGLRSWYRNAVSKATAVSVVSDTLLTKVQNEYHPLGILRTITNAVSPEIFHAGDKAAARRCLGLPMSRILIGTAGALTRARGIETLYQAYAQLTKIQPDLSLVLAGPRQRSMESLGRDDIIYLGNLPHERVGDLFRALDVGVVCNRDDEFGHYCFPQKFFEMLACRLPVVAANVGAMRGLLPGSEQYLFDPTSMTSLVNAIVAQLGNSQRPAISVPSWQDCGSKFGELIEVAVTASTRSIGALEPTQLTPEPL